MQQFKYYLIGSRFTLVTDSRNWRILLEKGGKSLSQRVNRWRLLISDFTFDVEQRPSAKMEPADYYSRHSNVSARGSVLIGCFKAIENYAPLKRKRNEMQEEKTE